MRRRKMEDISLCNGKINRKCPEITEISHLVTKSGCSKMSVSEF